MAVVFEFEDGADVVVERPRDLDILMPTAKEWAESEGGGVVTVRDSEDGRIITELFAGSGQLELDWKAFRGALFDEIADYYEGDDEDWYSST